MTITRKHGFDHQGRFIPNKTLSPPDPQAPKRLWPHQKRFLKELQDALYWFIIGPPAAGKTLTIMALLWVKLTADPKLRSIVVQNGRMPRKQNTKRSGAAALTLVTGEST